MQPVVPPRLKGAKLFRDLGGHAAADGRKVRGGRVFRCGTLAAFDEAGRAWLRDLGPTTVCDLRADRERDQEPPFDWLDAELLAWDYDKRLLGAGYDSVRTVDDARAAVLDFYQTSPWTFAPQFGAILHRLAEDAGPLLFHCSGGKDRTGVAAALVLSALGVPREAVVADYALTETLVDYERVIVARAAKEGRADAAGHAGIVRLDPEMRRPFLRSDPDYLRATFAAIDARHGALERYLEIILGMGPHELAALRDRLLA